MINFFKTIIYVPLYNFFVLILNQSWIDVGIATILLTILVKIILYPLSKKSIVTQIKMREKEGELKAIKEKYPDQKEQAVKVMEFYRTNNINPFSSIFILLIQIPIIYSLYYVFFQSGLPTIDTAILYSFVKVPESVSMMLFGFFDVSQKSFVLALLAALSTFFQMHLSSPTNPPSHKASADKEDFAKMMTKQMKYTMPIVVFFISWRISGVVALYWFVSNVVGIAQDWYIKKQIQLGKA